MLAAFQRPRGSAPPRSGGGGRRRDGRVADCGAGLLPSCCLMSTARPVLVAARGRRSAPASCEQGRRGAAGEAAAAAAAAAAVQWRKRAAAPLRAAFAPAASRNGTMRGSTMLMMYAASHSAMCSVHACLLQLQRRGVDGGNDAAAGCSILGFQPPRWPSSSQPSSMQCSRGPRSTYNTMGGESCGLCISLGARFAPRARVRAHRGSSRRKTPTAGCGVWRQSVPAQDTWLLVYTVAGQ